MQNMKHMAKQCLYLGYGSIVITNEP